MYRTRESLIVHLACIAANLGLEITEDQKIKEGDLYLAERNTGPQLLTCKEVKNGYTIPVEVAYCYDLSDCVRIREIMVYTIKVWTDDNAPDSENPYPLVKCIKTEDKQEAGRIAYHEWCSDRWIGVGVYDENSQLLVGYGLTQ